MVTFNDEFTRYSVVYFAKTKDEVAERFKDYHKWVRLHGYSIEVLTTDNGTEYDGGENNNPSTFNLVCEELGVRQRFTAYYPSAQNGTRASERRMNRTLGDCAACLLHDAALSHPYWSLAVKHVCWLRNRLIHRALNREGKPQRSPFQALFGRPAPDLLMAKVFGCDAFRFNHLRNKSELSPKGIRGVCVGISSDRKGWLILHPKPKTVNFISCVF